MSVSKSKWAKLVYFASTLLLFVSMFAFGILDIIEHEIITEVTLRLGYPLYFLKIIGAAKILGVLIALAMKRHKKIVEWVYIGFFFEIFIGLLSHIAVGDSFQVILMPLLYLIVWSISYVSFVKYE